MMCWYCRIPLTLAQAEKEHLTPRSRGGSDAIANIVPACAECNRLKGEMTEDEFRAERAYLLTVAKNSTAMPIAKTQMLEQKGESLVLDGRLEQIAIEAWQAAAAGSYDYARKLQTYIAGQIEHLATCGWMIGEDCTCLAGPRDPRLTAEWITAHPPDRQLSLAARDEPQLSKLRRESESGCPIGFRSYR
jgi:hypothetical protein